MSTHKWIDRICAGAVALALLLTVLFMNGEALGIQTYAAGIGYENRLFDNSRVHSIDIVMDDWDSFIKTAQNEVYSSCTVVIDGEAYKNVAIRGKGNTSLLSVASLNSQRYSFKLEFDHYDNTQTYHGLDKLCLNNMYQDYTMMKDYLAYTLMAEFGADAPLCSFVYITVNGEDWGLYVAVEAIEDSFMLRNYGSTKGDLYKPDTFNLGGGDAPGGGEDNGSSGGGEPDTGETQPADPNNSSGGGEAQPTDPNAAPEGGSEGSEGGEAQPTDPNAAPEGGSEGSEGGEAQPTDPNAAPEGGSEGSEGGEAQPTDPNAAPEGGSEGSEGGEAQPTDPNSTENQPANPEGGSGGSEGGEGVVTTSDAKLQYAGDNPSSYSLLFGSAKTEVSEADQARIIAAIKKINEGDTSAIDVDAMLRYFVVHNYVVNGDSYTGGIVHNYYLYEENGVLYMIPWDYNLAFGTFSGNDASGSVNDNIDRPQSVSGNDRPLIDWIYDSEEYTELYHQYFQEFLDTVDVTAIITQARELISPYVEKDPTRFCNYEEYEKAVDTLLGFCTLRSHSVSAQLDGQEGKIDTGNLNISLMGTMGGGGGGSGGGEDNGSSGGGEDTPATPNEGDTNPTAPEGGSEGSEGSEGGEAQPTDPNTTETQPTAPEGGSEGSEGSEGGEAQPTDPNSTETQPTAPEGGSEGSEGSEGGEAQPTDPNSTETQPTAPEGGSEGSEGSEGGEAQPTDPNTGETQPVNPEGGSEGSEGSEGGEAQPTDPNTGETQPVNPEGGSEGSEGGETQPADPNSTETQPANPEGGSAGSEGGEAQPTDPNSGETQPANPEGGSGGSEGGEAPPETPGGESARPAPGGQSNGTPGQNSSQETELWISGILLAAALLLVWKYRR